MRCTKCGFTSFDYLDRCKSCSEDLLDSKIKLNIYVKEPEIEVDEDGFVLSKVTEDKKDMLSSGSEEAPMPTSPGAKKEVSMEDILNQDGDSLESFDFGEDK